MATRRKPQKKKLKFELTKSGLAGIAVITFCLFLWMFLLGVWAGQSLLLPDYGGEKISTAPTKIATDSVPLIIRADRKAIKK